MFGLQYLAALLAAASFVSSAPAIRPQSFPHSFRRQASNSSSIAVLGATEGGVQNRLEVHALQQDTDSWNIYLLGLAKMQAMNASDPMSYYQIAGIHGQPFVAWDDVGACPDCSPAGYCTHSSNLFPTWHRAYMALFEQSLQQNALAAANEFSGDDQTRYVQAATNLRMPYWDWAQPPQANENPFPQLFTDATVDVSTPTGQQTVPNPLMRYTLNGDNSFLGHPTTVRSPTFTTTNRAQLRQDIWAMLGSSMNYNAFSNDAFLSSNDPLNQYSLESIHDSVHNLVGADMANLAVAAFDPVFWLHHAMVDRAFAIFQAAHSDVWVEPYVQIAPTFTYTAGTTEDSASALFPFHSTTAGDYWVSDSVRITDSLNYNYPDLASGEAAAQIINEYYDANDKAAPSSKKRSSLPRSTNSTSTSNTTTTVQEYIANIQADSMAVAGSFTVLLFDGPFDESNPAGWFNEDDLIGSHGFFTSNTTMEPSSDHLVYASIDITWALDQDVQGGFLANLTNDAVVPYLSGNIAWRVLAANGTVIPIEELPGLQLSIVTAAVTLPVVDTQMPVWGPWTVLQEITEGMATGFAGNGTAKV